MVIGFLRDWVIPGSFFFLLWTTTVGVVLLFRKRKSRVTLGRYWLAFVVLLYWTLSLPATSGWLLKGLGREFAPVVEAADANGATAIVVLGGGSASLRSGEHILDVLTSQSAFSVLEAVRVSRLLGTPLLIVSGGRPIAEQQAHSEAEVMRGALVSLGIPAERIVLDSDSADTRGQALAVPQLMRQHSITRAVLVTAPRHMPRAFRLFRARGADVVPSPAQRRSDGLGQGWWPSLEALQESRWTLHEFAALAYSWARGWL